jgi:hypothetical protein
MKREQLPLQVALAKFRAGKAPPRTGIARFGPAGEPEHLNAWCKRQGITKATGRKLFDEGYLKELGVVRGLREWFETQEGATEVLREHHEHGLSLVSVIKKYEEHADRLQRWKQRINQFLGQMENNYNHARKLQARQRALDAKLKRYLEARRRGDAYVSHHDLDALKKRLFGPDIVSLEKKKRRRNWRNYYRRRKQRALAAMRAVQPESQAAPQEQGHDDVLHGELEGGERSQLAGQTGASVPQLPDSASSG